MTKERVGIFGGSFDPPHRAHVKLVLEAQKEFSLDHLFIVPSKYPPGKTPVAPYEKRLEWCRTLFGSLPKIEVSELEANSSQTVFGKQIFSHLGLKYPSAQYYWILGEDQLDQLPYWNEVDSYGSELIWIALPRDGSLKRRGLMSRRLSQSSVAYLWTSSKPMVDVSSHRIREALQANLTKASKSNELEWIPKEIRTNVIETYQLKGEVKT